MAFASAPWRPLLLLAAGILALAALVPRLGLHGGQPWAHVGRAVLLGLLAGALFGWGRRGGVGAPMFVGWAYVGAAAASLVLALDVHLFDTSLPSMIALGAPLVAVAWELIVRRRVR